MIEPNAGTEAGRGFADYPPIGQRTALSSRSSLRSIAEGAPSIKAVMVATL
ncbi:MAG TPA: hypothetical protein PKM35_14995 [Holophaga sp.]|nr:hypothetical protein [Holophaga sp.]